MIKTKDKKSLKKCKIKLDKDQLIELICKHCEFYKESEKELECGAYKILKALLEKGLINPEEIKDAINE